MWETAQLIQETDSTNAIELIRVSTEQQAGSDRASIPAQHSVNKATAIRYELDIIKTIELSDVSGASVLLAPEIQSLIEFIQSPDIGGVVTREFSRLMRPEKFSDYALLQAFADSKTKLYLPEGPIDFSEKSGRLMGTIRAAIAGLERSEIQERCWRGKEEKRKAGKKVSSTLPVGVGYDKQRGWFYTEDAERVLHAYEMVLSGETRYSEISACTGVSQGEMFNILHNPIYKGWRVYDKKCDPTKRHTRADGRQGWSEKIQRKPDEVIRVQVIADPLISPEHWAAACKILEAKRAAHRRERGKGYTLYNGFLFCDICGSRMVPLQAASGNYYVCRNRKNPGKWGPKCEQPYLRAEVLEKEIDRILECEVTSPRFAHKIAEQLESKRINERVAARIERLQGELKSLEARRNRVIDSYVDGVLTREARDERLKALTEFRAKVVEELDRARGSECPSMTVDQITQAFQVFAEWDFLAREDRRKILSVTIPRIRVHNFSVVGFYRLFDGSDVDVSRSGAAQPFFCRTKNALS